MKKVILIISGILITVFGLYAIIFFNMANRAFKYFDYKEFDSPATAADRAAGLQNYFNPLRGKYYLTDSGLNHMSAEFISKLDKAREIAGVPFFINSGYRTPEYNATLENSVSDSSHIKGLAADIAAPAFKETIIRALIAAGFKRIGEGANFIHVDNDQNKPQFAYWTYNGVAQTVFNPWG